VDGVVRSWHEPIMAEISELRAFRAKTIFYMTDT
jgi:hypothetical protein